MSALSSALRILVVDDMAAFRQVMCAILKSLGLTSIVEAEDGKIALECITDAEHANSPIDLVICDLSMPNVSGIDLLKQLRATPRTAKLPFIMVTAEKELSQITEAVREGVSEYIVKPFSEQQLKDKIQFVVERHCAP